MEAQMLQTLQVNSFIYLLHMTVGKFMWCPQIVPYLHMTVSKYMWCYFGHFPAHDREYKVLYFDMITWLIMIG